MTNEQSTIEQRLEKLEPGAARGRIRATEGTKQMAMVILGLALYLMALAKWGKSLKAKNATLKRRRIYGLVGAAPPLLAPFVFGIGTFGSWENLFLCTWYATCAVLDYTTVVYAPQWIVGKPKPPKIRIR